MSGVTDQARKLMQSLPNLASYYEAAGARGVRGWYFVEWKNVEPSRVQLEDILCHGLNPDEAEDITLTDALHSNDLLVWQNYDKKDRTQRGHVGVWRCKVEDGYLYRTVLPIIAVTGHSRAAHCSIADAPHSDVVVLNSRTYGLAQQMAREDGKSLEQVVEEAVRELDRRKFFDKVDAAYRALRNDPVAWQEELEERKLLEGTLKDGLRDEGEYAVEERKSA